MSNIIENDSRPLLLPATVDSGREKHEQPIPSWSSPEDLALVLAETTEEVGILSGVYERAIADIAKYDPEHGTRVQQLETYHHRAAALMALRAKLEHNINITDPKVLEQLQDMFPDPKKGERKEAESKSITEGALTDETNEMLAALERPFVTEKLAQGDHVSPASVFDSTVTFHQHKPPALVASQLARSLAEGQLRDGTRLGTAIRTIAKMEQEIAELGDTSSGSDVPLKTKLALGIDALLDQMGFDAVFMVRRIEEITEQAIRIGLAGISTDFESVLRNPSSVVDYAGMMSYFLILKWVLSRIDVQTQEDSPNLPVVVVHGREQGGSTADPVKKMAVQLSVVTHQKHVLEQVIAELQSDPILGTDRIARIEDQIAVFTRQAQQDGAWIAQYRSISSQTEKKFLKVVAGMMNGKGPDSTLATAQGSHALLAIEQVDAGSRIFSEIPVDELISFLKERKRLDKDKEVELVVGYYHYPDDEKGVKRKRSDYFDKSWKRVNSPDRILEVDYHFFERLLFLLSQKYDWGKQLHLEPWTVHLEGFDKSSQINRRFPAGFYAYDERARQAYELMDNLVIMEQETPANQQQMYRWMQKYAHPNYHYWDRDTPEVLPRGSYRQMLVLKNYKETLDQLSSNSTDIALLHDGYLLLFEGNHNHSSMPLGYRDNNAFDRNELFDWIKDDKEGFRVNFKPELFHKLPQTYNLLDWRFGQIFSTTIKIIPYTAEAQGEFNQERENDQFFVALLERLYGKLMTQDERPTSRNGLILLPAPDSSS